MELRTPLLGGVVSDDSRMRKSELRNQGKARRGKQPHKREFLGFLQGLEREREVYKGKGCGFSGCKITLFCTNLHSHSEERFNHLQ